VRLYQLWGVDEGGFSDRFGNLKGDKGRATFFLTLLYLLFLKKAGKDVC